MRLLILGILVLVQAGPPLIKEAVAGPDSSFQGAMRDVPQPIEQRLGFSNGVDSHTTLSYSSPASSGDSLGAMLANGFNYGTTRRAGNGFLHFSLTDNARSNHKLMGGTFGKLQLSFLQGEGDGLSRHRSAIGGIASNFFHGAATRSYRYSGAGIDWSWTDRLSTHAGAIVIDAPYVNERSVHFGGITFGNFTATLHQVQRNVEAGHGLSLGWRSRSFSFGLEALESSGGAVWQEMSAGYRHRNGGTFRLSLSHGSNDLYAGAADSRIGLAYKLSFGGPKRTTEANHKAASFQGLSAGSAAAKFTDLSRIGIGAVSIGLVVSSGDPALDAAPRYPTQTQSAFAALSLYNPISVRRNLEYAGSIYRNPDGTYSPSDKIVVGTAHSVAFNPHWLVPRGTFATAAWHTHAAADPQYAVEAFSPADIQFALIYQIDIYLGTPLGRMFEYVRLERMIYQYVGPNNNEFILPH